MRVSGGARAVSGPPRRRRADGGSRDENVGSTYHWVALGRLQQREGQHLARWWFWTPVPCRSRLRRVIPSPTAGVSRREERGLRARSSGSGLRGRSRTLGLCHRSASVCGDGVAAARVCPANRIRGRAPKTRLFNFAPARAMKVPRSRHQQRQFGFARVSAPDSAPKPRWRCTSCTLWCS